MRSQQIEKGSKANDSCMYLGKERKSWTDTRDNTAGRHRQGLEWCGCKPVDTKECGSPPQARQRPKTFLPCSLQVSSPANTLVSLPQTEGLDSCCLKPPGVCSSKKLNTARTYDKCQHLGQKAFHLLVQPVPKRGVDSIGPCQGLTW